MPCILNLNLDIALLRYCDFTAYFLAANFGLARIGPARRISRQEVSEGGVNIP